MRTYKGGVVEVTGVITKKNRDALENKGTHCCHICFLEVDRTNKVQDYATFKSYNTNPFLKVYMKQCMLNSAENSTD